MLCFDLDYSKLRHYLSSYTTYLISRMDPLKYIFQKVMLIGKLGKWKMLLSEFDIVYATQKAIKVQALANHLAENLVDEEYELLKTFISEAYLGWRVFFDGATNDKGRGIGEVLVSEYCQH